MSEPLEPGEELVDQTTEEAATDGDPQAQEGENQETDTEVADEGDELSDEDTAGERKLSRFQRFKQEQEALVLEKERELRYWRDVALKQAPVEPAAKAEEDLEPQLNDFDGQSIDAYLQAHTKWTQKQLLAQARKEAAEAVRQERQNAILQAQVAEARKELKDWDEVMARSHIPAMQDTAEFILSSELGPKLAYHLAKNPTEHQRLNNLPPVRRLAELGKLEDRLSAGKAAAVAPVATKAPAKLSSVKGSTVVTTDTAVAARQGREAWKAARAAAVKK
jgi:hypothetical protein